MTRRLRFGKFGKAGTLGFGAVGLAASTTALSGCMYLSPTQTNVSYDGGLGSNTTIGQLQFSNVLIVAKSQGAPGSLQGLVTNSSDTAVPLMIAVGGSTAQVSVPADTAIRLDGQASGNSTDTGTAVQVAKTPVQPGAKTTVTFGIPGTGQTPVLIPVLLPGQAYKS